MNASLRHALRDLRQSVRYLRLLSICLILSVGVMSAVGLVVGNIKAGIERDASSLLGGDIEIRKLYEPLKYELKSHLSFSSKKMSRTMDMRAMAQNGDRQTLIELKAVDKHYPLYGKMQYKKKLPSQKKRKTKKKSFEKGTIYDAAVDQSLLDLLNIRLGSIFKVGEAYFIADKIIESEPDRGFSTMTMGPRVMVSHRAFESTELLQYGSMVYYRYRLLLPNDISSEAYKKSLTALYPDSNWRIRDKNDSAPGLITLIDRLSLFFALTAITTLMVAGVGIANATNVYVWRKRQTIALMKSLGASQRHIDLTYLIQILLVSTVSIAIGCALGVAGEMLLLNWLQNLLNVTHEHLFSFQPVILSALLALTTVLLFTFLPLFRSRYIKPAALLRGHNEQLEQYKLPAKYIGALAVLVLILVGLGIAYTNTVKITVSFAVGLGVAMLILHALGKLLQHIANRGAHSGRFSVSFSIILANLARPGSVTRSMVIALGVSMSLIIALVQVGENLRAQIAQGLPENAPSFFLADIQPSQIRALTSQLESLKGAYNFHSLPISRGRIVRLNDVPVENVVIKDKARWAIRSERGLTEAATPPNADAIVEGSWWAADYKGPPLVSFDRKLAEGMELTIGDTITIATIDKSIKATIANLRDIQWGSLEMNFAIILSPGTLEGLPITHLTTFNIPEESEGAAQRMLAKHYNNVVVVRVREVLGQVSGILENVSTAVLFTAAITVLCSILVMASAIYASLHKRTFDTIIYKVLGANKKRILHMYLMEFAIIAVVVAVIAFIIGSIAAYSVMQLMIFSNYQPLPHIALSAVMVSLITAILLGMIATRITLAVRPLSLLRNE